MHKSFQTFLDLRVSMSCCLLSIFMLLPEMVTAQNAKLDRSPEAHLKRITDEVKFLASDELEGRGVNTPGITTAANYIRDEFKKYGLKSGTEDGTYFQPFPVRLRGVVVDKKSTLSIGKKTLKNGVEFEPQNCGGNADIEGDLVFAGYGIDAPDLGYSDYENIDVKGQVVIVIRLEPQQADEKSKFNGKLPSEHAYIRNKMKAAREHGAAGILFVNDQVRSGKGKKDELAVSHKFGRTNDSLPMAFVKRSVIDEILANNPLKSGDRVFKSLAEFETDVDKSLKPLSQQMDGHRVSYKANFYEPTVTTSNVVGVVEGEGPNKDETIVIGGHYDHLGYGYYGSLAKNRVGEIHNGADDNATGTIAVVELARRFATAKKKPGRRLVFIAFSGEERGLIGSFYYCRQPLFPLENTVAMINYDMIGQLKGGNLTVFGGTSGEGLDAVVRKAGEGTKLKLNLVPGGFAGSDHLPFNSRKIPNMFLHTGTHSGLYHTPDDDFSTINMKGMAEVIDYSETLISELASLEKRLPYKSATRPRRNIGYLGVQSDPDSEVKGSYIAKVLDDSPAESAGFKVGDVIVKVGDTVIESPQALSQAMRSRRPGQKVKIRFLRGGKEMGVEVALGNPPAQ